MRLLRGAEVRRETQRAVLVTLGYSLCDGEPRATDVWLPLSQVEIRDDGVAVPEWLLIAREQELSERRFRGNQVYISSNAVA